MNEATIGYYLTWGGTLAWGVCFLWMHRISSRQDALLAELRDQNERIEAINQQQHAILREVHPEVGQIKEAVEIVSQDLADVRRDNIAQAVISEQVVEQIARIEEAADKVIEAGEHLAAEAEPAGAGAARS